VVPCPPDREHARESGQDDAHPPDAENAVPSVEPAAHTDERNAIDPFPWKPLAMLPQGDDRDVVSPRDERLRMPENSCLGASDPRICMDAYQTDSCTNSGHHTGRRTRTHRRPRTTEKQGGLFIPAACKRHGEDRPDVDADRLRPERLELEAHHDDAHG